MMLFRFKRLSGAAALAVLLFSASIAWAQVTTANLSGVVQDTSNSVIPGAEVTLTNDATGLVYNTQSGAGGDFLFSVLPTGTYTLSIQTAGFKVYEATGITLAASQNIRQQHTLEVGALTETVTVEGAPPLISTQASEQTESIDQAKVSELPLGRRNITNILRLSSGVDTGKGGLRINGMGKSGAGVTVNGTDANSNPSEGRALEQYGGRNYMDVVSIEAVEEVQIMRGVMKAENGGVISGTINLISKQGTNQWHGSGFNNYRSHVLDARHPFGSNVNDDGTMRSKNRTVFNQFGGSIGGPIVRNKLFLFGVYEGYREYTSAGISGSVPTPLLRQTILDARPEPEMKTLLDTIPEGTNPIAGNIYRSNFEGVGSRSRTENHVILRGDYRPTDSGQLSYTYTRNRPIGIDPRINLNGANDREYIYRTDRHTGQYTHTGSNWVSESRFGYNHADMDRLDNYFTFMSPNGEETTPWQHRGPRIRLDNLEGGDFNAGSAEVFNMIGNTYTIDQKITLIKGNHSLKFGGRMVWYGGSRTNPENVRHIWDTGDGFEQLQGNVSDGATFSFGSNGPHNGRQYEIGGFVQDDWRVNSKLMLNIGARYDYYSNNVVTATGDVDVTNKNLELPAGADFSAFAFGARRPFDNPIDNDSWVNIGPRFGFAYEMNNKTVIRGGVGIMFAAQVPALLRQSTAGPDIPFRITYARSEAQAIGVEFPMTNQDVRPISLADVQARGTELVFSLITPDLQNPYTINYQFNIQRQLSDSLMWEIGYVGIKGNKFPLHRRMNLADRQTGIRPNPLIIPGGPYFVDMGESVQNHSLQTSLRKRMTNRLSFDFHYTWGKTIAYSGGDVGVYYGTDATSGGQDFFNLGLEKATPGFDTTHRAVADLIYELPRFESLSAPLRAVFGGWQISTIYGGTTGTPVNTNQGCSNQWSCRADYIGGEIYSPAGQTFSSPRPFGHQDVQYVNPDAFAEVAEVGGVAHRPGNVNAGLVRAPGRWTIDLSIAKNFQLAESVRMQIRADAFNSLNHVNLSSLGGRVDRSDFGTLDNADTMRNMQLSARITF
jgi:outer membrane receptor protein involved in Fe transport